MGEGWGEGEYNAISTTYTPLPFVPSRQGRGNLTFYESIKKRKDLKKYVVDFRLTIDKF
jgi:hypothetical protein